ncbi:hypothetical protein VTK56DRAFT_8275 [Thermocarpiscus australiensis]
MSTMAATNLSEVPVSDLYDPDDVLPRNSPLLEPRRPKLRPPSPVRPPSLLSSTSPPSSPDNKGSFRRGKARNFQGYAVLISHLDGHRRGTAAYAAIESLVSDPEDTDDGNLGKGCESPDCGASPRERRVGGGKDSDGSNRMGGERFCIQDMASGSSSPDKMGAFDLKSLAADALAAVTDSRPEPADAGPTPPVTENDVIGGRPQGPLAPVAIPTRRAEHSKEERAVQSAMLSSYSPGSLYSPRESGATPLSLKVGAKSPTASISSSTHGEGLPPIQLNSPRSDTNGQTLPSIRSQLGDIQQLANNHVAENDTLRTLHHSFPGSPPASLPRLPSLHGHRASPPVLSAEPYRDPLSPSHSLASPGYYYSPTNGLHRPPEYVSSSRETPSSEQSSSTAGPSIADRMSIDGITIQQPGIYVCKFPGCTAAPFQTQYLLNSHANVHSTSRPHYCPVPGCPRAEGGKGFKRKNEMIRHGLVHESPGYVCPFCPDREHKYPRPDNLQRHVRVHHVDKDKDDPLLRDVLSQRPDGPNRGRRRRGAPSS